METPLAGWHALCLSGAAAMIDPLFQTNTMALAEKLLDASAMRQDAIAANLANAETPGYHRVDLAADFATRLKAAYSTATDGSAESLAAQLSTVQPALAEDPSARSVRPDGNNVEVDHELIAMDENSVNYQYLTDVVTYNIKQLKLAITGQAT